MSQLKPLDNNISASILEQIKKHDKHTPVYSIRLEELFNLHGSQLRAYIRQLRNAGEPIVMCSKGYYYEDSPEAAEKTATNLQARAHSLLKTANNLLKRYKKGQYKITFNKGE